MKRLTMMIVAAAAMTLGMLAVPVMAQQKIEDIQICTGGKDGNYAKVGHLVQGQMKQLDGHRGVQVVYTQGSVQNLRMMMNERGDKSGWCDVALTQEDALFNFEKENGQAKEQIARLLPLYTEKVHFLMNRDAAKRLGVSRIPDLIGKDATIAVGTAGSGNFESWKALTSVDKRYTKIGINNDRQDRALVKVADGENVQGMIVTSGLKTPFMMDVLKNYGDRIVLIGFNDGDLKDLKNSKGKPLYTLTEIPAGMYRAIQPSGLTCMGSCSVSTAEVGALMVYSTKWEDQAGDAFKDLVTATNNIKSQARKLNDPAN